jgi:hypothetical protein
MRVITYRSNKLNSIILATVLFLPIYTACQSAEVNTIRNVKGNTTKSETDNSGTEQTKYPNLKKQADEMGKAMMSGDYEKFVEFLHPRAFEIAGTKQRMISSMKETMKELKDLGVEFGDYIIEAPTKIITENKVIYALMPTISTAKLNNKTSKTVSSLLGISDDDGNNWKFIRLGSQEALKVYFPKIADKFTVTESKTETN